MMLALMDWIAELFENPTLLAMGHAQRAEDANLGLGWLYYGLARIVRPRRVVVIGSHRGFAPLVFARALADSGEGGRVAFIDPSLVDDFWKDEAAVQAYFAGHGVTNIDHHLMTTQQFVESDTYHELSEMGIVFIDGYHSAEQAQFDFDAFASRVTPQGMILLHDSVWRLPSRIYGPQREYVHTVADFVDGLKRQSQWQVFDVPFGHGLTLVRPAIAPAPPARSKRPAGTQVLGCTV